MIVITKIDICPKNVLEQTIKSINKTLKRYKYNRPLIFLDDNNYDNYYDFLIEKMFFLHFKYQMSQEKI